MPAFTWIDYGILLAYLAVSLGVGLAMCRRASRDGESYFLGGRMMPWWVNGISLAATSLASDTPLVITEMVRDRGVQRLWWLFASTLTLIVGVFLFARLWRRLGAMTDAEFCELRYDGPAAAALRAVRAFISGVVANLLTIGWVTLGMASILTVMMPVDRWAAVWIALGVTLLYTMLGGFLGAVLTDVLQFVIAVVAMTLLAIVSVHAFGGMDAVLAAVRAAPGHGERTLTLLPSFSDHGLDLACFVIVIGLWWGDAGGYVMQRLSACRSERDAVKAMLFFAVWQAVRPWMWAVVALVSIALWPVLPAGRSDTQAYALVMNEYLGPGLKGLLVTAFAAAFMSTITTQLNWGASYLMGDFYCRFFRPQAAGREYILVSRAVTVLLALAGMAVVPLLASVTQAWEFLALLTAGSGFFGVIRWFWWRINAWTELSAISIGLGCAVGNLLLNHFAPAWTFFGSPWPALRFELKLALFTAIVVPSSLAVTFLTAPVDRAKLEAFYRRVRPGGWWSGLSPAVRALPDRALNRGSALGLLWGFSLCAGSTLAVGYALLQQPAAAGAGLVLATTGGIGFVRWFRRETFAPPPPAPAAARDAAGA
jgi:SSS family transporter